MYFIPLMPYKRVGGKETKIVYMAMTHAIINFSLSPLLGVCGAPLGLRGKGMMYVCMNVSVMIRNVVN